MHVPNIVDLHLKFDSLTMRYLLKELRYPFKLLRLSMNPYKDATFVKFLKTQPEIRHLTLTSNQFNFSYNLTQEWSEVASPLEPDILPNLESIQCDTESISFLVPHRPITSVSILGSQEDFHFHQVLVKSSAPLERLTERVRLEDSPWEAAIVSQCLPSLEFCQTSLTEYSLGIFPDPTSHPLVHNSALYFLEFERQNGLAKIRNAITAFSELRKLHLRFRSGQFNDLTSKYCNSVPELSQFRVWKKSCTKLEEVTIFGITLTEQ
ncbi:hypothetical protein RSAG8_13739, partial [Rhizoctonia solani AG-8 WAC10335]